MKTTFLTIGFTVLSFVLFLWSFTLTDPNLLYSSNPTYVELQRKVIQTDRQTITWMYVGLVVCYVVLYLGLIRKKNFPLVPFTTFSLLLGALFLVLSNNALSHDIYNYMFNAKAVTWYQKDPHLQSALEIGPEDDWLRFMHNVHTPAPYGKLWTTLSLIPYTLGGGKFLSTFLSFKVFMLLGLLILFFLQQKLALRKHEDHWKGRWWWFFMSPLVFIETLLNGHNDVWMMTFAFASLLLLTYTKRLLSWQALVSGILLLLSIQIKLGTVLILPVWIILLCWESGLIKILPKKLRGMGELIALHWADLSALLIFLPLLTERSQQFHPWYLIWPLSFIPFMKHSLLKTVLLTFSLTSILRYVPFLLEGGYSDTIQFQMRLISWMAIPIGLIVFGVLKTRKII